jgi:PAS domain S-box-containing protein
MKKDNKSEAINLRQRAEEVLKKKHSEKNSKLSEADVLKLIHEFEVHQVELELINEELLEAKTIAAEAAEKYIELYDFAPTGYFTLSKNGNIIDINLSGALLLGKERSRLINSTFGLYISDDTKPTFAQFLEKVLNSNNRELCEVIMTPSNNLLIYAHITGVADMSREQCYLTVIDITEHKKAEFEIVKKTDQLELINSHFMGREMKMIELKQEINELLKELGRGEKYVIHK